MCFLNHLLRPQSPSSSCCSKSVFRFHPPLPFFNLFDFVPLGRPAEIFVGSSSDVSTKSTLPEHQAFVLALGWNSIFSFGFFFPLMLFLWSETSLREATLDLTAVLYLCGRTDSHTAAPHNCAETSCPTARRERGGARRRAGFREIKEDHRGRCFG